jgi:hypothetical protein
LVSISFWGSSGTSSWELLRKAFLLLKDITGQLIPLHVDWILPGLGVTGNCGSCLVTMNENIMDSVKMAEETESLTVLLNTPKSP